VEKPDRKAVTGSLVLLMVALQSVGCGPNRQTEQAPAKSPGAGFQATDAAPDAPAAAPFYLLIERARAQFNGMYLEPALRTLGEVIRLHPNEPSAYSLRASVLETLEDAAGAAKDRQTAKEILQRVIVQQSVEIDANPGRVQAYLLRAQALLERGDWKGALRDYDRAVAVQPGSSVVYLHRADFHCLEFRERQAIEDYTRALILDAANATARNNRGLARFALKEYAEAIEDYSAAVALEPKQPRNYDNRGAAWYRWGKRKEAISDFSKAIALDPLYVTAWHNRALARLEEGDVDGAIADATSAIRLPGHSAASFNLRGYAYFKKGDNTSAIRDHTIALERDRPKKIRYGALVDRADARAAGGDIQGAVEDYTEAIKEQGRLPEAYQKRAQAYRRLGMEKEALGDERMGRDLEGSEGR